VSWNYRVRVVKRLLVFESTWKSEDVNIHAVHDRKISGYFTWNAQNIILGNGNFEDCKIVFG
jgi:hypothetical protein